MNKRRDVPGQAQLPLPAPRSPRALDERVLKAAREQLPTKQRYRQPWWLAGTATVSVLVIAVMLTQTATPPDVSTTSSNELAPVASEEMVLTATPAAKIVAAMSVAPRAAMIKEENIEAAVGEQPATAAPERQRFSYADSMDEAEAPNTPQDIAKSLHALADLLHQGEEEEANKGYEALKASCPGCNLPETLEEALEFSYPPTP